MNATEKTRALSSPSQFLTEVENFNKKCQAGKPLPTGEVQEFFRIITDSTRTMKEGIGSKISSDPQANQKIIQELQNLMKTLGQKTEVIRKASEMMPAQPTAVIKETLDLFVQQQKREAGKVSRKETDQLSP